MTEHDDTDRQRLPALSGNVVLLVSSSGSIHRVLEAPSFADGNECDADELSYLQRLWPEDTVARLRKGIGRVIRGRETHRETIGNYEFLLVAQGRDRALLVAQDLLSRGAELSDAQDLAYRDRVTGLPNREFLVAELGKIAQAQQLKEGRVAAICLHVDQFDDHGYSLSSIQRDQILVELAARLRAQLRGSNEVDNEDLERLSIVARTDFQQFTIVLPSIECGEHAEAVVERLLATLTQPVSVGARTIGATVYGGVSLFPQDGTDADTLLDNAHAAVEDARNSKPNSWKLHSGTVRLRSLQRQDLEVELRTALERDEYSLKFLPIVSAGDHETVAIEALLRWPETILGTHPTRRVVAIAERTGLILPIGEWVLTNALEQLASWHEAGHADLRIAINLSAQEFSRSDLASRVHDIVDRSAIDTGLVDFEISEHVLTRDALSGYPGCKALKDLDVRIFVDDFGTGNCSLAHLAQSPVDGIKIDPVFTQHLQTGDRFRAAASAMISLAAELGLNVVAEGVEDTAQAELLAEMGCPYLQGFCFAAPLSESDVLAFLDDPEDADARCRSAR
ncbi:MAG: phosphodiesterase [Woeseiaceae bacterium]|nr:phosphodiesterase [Woeseiaceae bacterium]